MVADSKTLHAARGWIELGLADEALTELQTLPVSQQKSICALEVKILAQMECKIWNAASDTARILCAEDPMNAGYFLQAAFCLHETGDTLAARNWLLRGPRTLLEMPTFHYNMGCYLWVLGEWDSARTYLDQAFEMEPTLKDFASLDRDLQGYV